jgi:hypothetical protein
LMGVSRRETAQIIGNVIADDFVPRLYAEWRGKIGIILT